MTVQVGLTFGADLSVPSPLAGEGQGGGCPTARSFGLSSIGMHLLSPSTRQRRAPFPGPPLSPTLPRKRGGWEMCLRLERSLQRLIA
jgi:hypothetical protein